MKKILIAVVVVCLLIVPSFSLAEALDFSAYTDGELLTLLEQVQAEVVNRHIQKTATLQAGTYIGGRDIPAGSYILTNIGTEGQDGIISLRSVNDPEKSYPSKLYEFIDAEDGFTVFVVIEEGDTLVLPCPYTITIHGGFVFE